MHQGGKGGDGLAQNVVRARLVMENADTAVMSAAVEVLVTDAVVQVQGGRVLFRFGAIEIDIPASMLDAITAKKDAAIYDAKSAIA